MRTEHAYRTGAVCGMTSRGMTASGLGCVKTIPPRVHAHD
jgi:hypothetical protein